METDQEYVSSATLMILGDALEPAIASKELSLIPSQSWRKGDQKEHTRADGSKLVLDSRHEWGGWKLFVDPKCRDSPLESQIESLCETLHGKAEVIARLKSNGMHCILDLFLTTNATASLILSEDLQNSLLSLGLEIQLSISTSNESEQRKVCIDA